MKKLNFGGRYIPTYKMVLGAYESAPHNQNFVATPNAHGLSDDSFTFFLAIIFPEIM